MRAHIIYNYLKPDGSGISIGGVQTYITNLIPLLKESGYAITIYQWATKDFHQEFDNYDVYGLKDEGKDNKKKAEILSSYAFLRITPSSDLLIYGTDFLIKKYAPCRSIAIQHGIAWDVPFNQCSHWRYFRHFLGKCKDAWYTIQRISKVDQLVCVDYNFVNWHRAISPYPKTKHIVIPNFSVIPSSIPEKNNKIVHIIFARRLFTYRGTRLFANVAERLLNKYHDIKITIAGTGPDEKYIQQKLSKYTQVEFCTYNNDESLSIHADKDIAVVPTLGSEGTSLSLLEAMASGCAVVCTNVGGMTNIILDGYNGYIINPEEEALYAAMISLIENKDTRKMLQLNAYNTVSHAFSLEKWQKKWLQVIKQTN